MSNQNVEDVYPLTPIQEGMLFHSLLAPEGGVYITQIAATLKGLNVSAFERVWQRVVDRHTILRTAFVWNKVEKPLQIVGRHVKLPIEKQDWRHLSAPEQEARFEQYLSDDRRRGYELTRMPLMRLALFRVSEETYKFLWSHHHLLIDGWSGAVLLQEVFSLYEAFCRGQDPDLGRPRPYRDYIRWLQQRDLSQAETYWRRTLQGFTAATPLDLGQAPDGDMAVGDDYGQLRVSLSPETTARLKTMARENQLTMNTVAQGAWALLLHRYSNERDVVFGATVSGRPPDLEGVESMVGLFINTLPVRIRVSPEAKALSWLQHLQSQQIELRQYEYSPLVRVQEWSEVPRGTPLFESILVFENYPVDESLSKQGGSVEVLDVRAAERTNYPLTLGVMPGRALSLMMIYDRRRFDDPAVARVLKHLGLLLEGIAADPDQPLSRLTLLTEVERRQLLDEWSHTGVDYSRGPSFHVAFEQQVREHPDKVAAVYADTTLTFRQLNDRAGQLANLLKRLP